MTHCVCFSWALVLNPCSLWGGCTFAGSVEPQAGRGCERPALMEGGPAHDRGWHWVMFQVSSNSDHAEILSASAPGCPGAALPGPQGAPGGRWWDAAPGAGAVRGAEQRRCRGPGRRRGRGAAAPAINAGSRTVQPAPRPRVCGLLLPCVKLIKRDVPRRGGGDAGVRQPCVL